MISNPPSTRPWPRRPRSRLPRRPTRERVPFWRSWGRPHEALILLERAIALNPRLPEALNNRGAVLRGLDRLQEAYRCFEEALAAAPDYADARYNLAGTLVKLERYDEAMPHYERLIDVLPNSAEIQAAYGKLLWKSGRTDEAIGAFTRAISLDPSFADVRGEYASALTEAGRIDEAVATLEDAIALAPSRPEFYHSLAETRVSSITPAHVAALEAMLREGALSDDDRISVDFALGKVYESGADRARSFGHFLQANAVEASLQQATTSAIPSSRLRASPRPLRRHFSMRGAAARSIRTSPSSSSECRDPERRSSSRFSSAIPTFPRAASSANLKTPPTPFSLPKGPYARIRCSAASCERLREIAERYRQRTRAARAGRGYAHHRQDARRTFVSPD